MLYREQIKQNEPPLFFPQSLGSQKHNLYSFSCLSLPQSLDGLGDADIAGLVLVEGKADNDGGGVEAPDGSLAGPGCSVLRNVIDDDVLEAGVRVDEEGGAQDGIHGGVERAGGERSDGKGDQGRSDETVKGPVVGAVRGRRGRYGGSIVDCMG